MSEQESYLIELSDKLVPLTWQEPPPALSEPERVFVRVWQLEAEVNNGGFAQYYFNSAGDLAAEAPAALEAIGATHTAGIVRGANAVFPAGPPREQDAREELLDSIPAEAFAPFDEGFLAYTDDLSSLLYAYVQSHREQIRGA